MSKRAALVALAAFSGAAPALAEPLTAEQALEAERAGILGATGLAPCPRDRDPDDIVVCGRRGPDPNRLPLPAERRPGDREHLLPGELPGAQASFSTCVIGCQPSGIMVNPFLVAKVSAKIVRHILNKDD